MVTRENFIIHMDRIRGYDKLQQNIDTLTGKVMGGGNANHGMVEFDMYPMVLEMMKMLDDCLDTPYVNILDWTMTRKVTEEMKDINNYYHFPRLIEAWATEMEYGEGERKTIYDEDHCVSVLFESPEDLYDYIYCSSYSPFSKI